jgi:hypothetical protein
MVLAADLDLRLPAGEKVPRESPRPGRTQASGRWELPKLDEPPCAQPWQVVRLRVFRVTYASARVQTSTGEHLKSIWTVQQEMGHGSLEMLKDVYVPVGNSRRRGEDVA